MFAKTIVDSDAFIDMPLSTQALYFHLAMRADDDGFLNNAQKIMRMIGAARNDIDLLIAKRFVITFPDGICVIKHWRMHNYIRSDRYKPTVYEEEMSALTIKENGAYTLELPTVNQMDTVGIPNDTQRGTQDRLGKVRLGEESIGEGTEGDKPPSPAHKRGEHGYVKLTDEEYEKLVSDLGADEAARVIAYVDESAAATGNKNKWKKWNLVLRKASREGWGQRYTKEVQKKDDRATERNFSGDGFRKRV